MNNFNMNHFNKVLLLLALFVFSADSSAWSSNQQKQDPPISHQSQPVNRSLGASPVVHPGPPPAHRSLSNPPRIPLVRNAQGALVPLPGGSSQHPLAFRLPNPQLPIHRPVVHSGLPVGRSPTTLAYPLVTRGALTPLTRDGGNQSQGVDRKTPTQFDFRYIFMFSPPNARNQDGSLQYFPNHGMITGACNFLEDGAGIKVGIFEPGVDYDHQGFQRHSTSVFFKKANKNNEKDTGHGTHVAGLIAGQSPHIGVAQGVTLQHISYEDGLDTTDKDLDILNTSCSHFKNTTSLGYFADNQFNETKDFERIAGNNTLLCATYGNKKHEVSSFDIANYYARALEKLATSEKVQGKMMIVGSLDLDTKTGEEKISSFSERAAQNSDNIPNIFAPGSNILSYKSGGNHKSMIPHNGTSLACPIVSGNLALFMEKFQEWKRTFPEIYIDLLLAGARTEKILTYNAGEQFFSSDISFGCVDLVMSKNLALLVGDSAQNPKDLNVGALRRSMNFTPLSQCRTSFYIHASQDQKETFIKMYGTNLEEAASMIASGRATSIDKWDMTPLREGDSLGTIWYKEKTMNGLDRFIKRLDYKLSQDTIDKNQDRQKTLLTLRERAAKARATTYASPWEREQKIYQYFEMGGGRLFAPNTLFLRDKEIFLTVRMRQKLHNALYDATQTSAPQNKENLHKIRDIVDFDQGGISGEPRKLKEFDQVVDTAIAHSKKVDQLYFKLKEEKPGCSHRILQLLVYSRLYREEGTDYLTTTESKWKELSEATEACLQKAYTPFELTKFIGELSRAPYSVEAEERQKDYQKKAFSQVLLTELPFYKEKNRAVFDIPSAKSLSQTFQENASIKFSGKIHSYNREVCYEMVQCLQNELLGLDTAHPGALAHLMSTISPFLQKIGGFEEECQKITTKIFEKISQKTIEFSKKEPDALMDELFLINSETVQPIAHLYKIADPNPQFTDSFQKSISRLIQCLLKGKNDTYDQNQYYLQDFISFIKASGMKVPNSFASLEEMEKSLSLPPQPFSSSYQKFMKDWNVTDATTDF